MSRSSIAIRVLCLLAVVSVACSNASEPERYDGVDRSLRFDGVDDYFTSPTKGFPTGITATTIELWFAPDRTTTMQTLVEVGRGSLSGVRIGLDGETPTAWRIWGPTVFAASDRSVEAGVWHHLGYVFDGETHAIYLDGVLVGTGSEYANNRSPTLLWAGAEDGTSEFFAGRIDELCVWDEARSETELASGASTPIADDAAGLVLHFTFDEVDGARIYDQSPQGNHGLLGDGVATFMPQRVPSDR